MSTVKIAITIEESLLNKLDRLVRTNIFPNRSRAIQEAISDKLAKISQIRTLSVKRLTKKIEKVSHEELDLIIEGLGELIG